MCGLMQPVNTSVGPAINNPWLVYPGFTPGEGLRDCPSYHSSD